MTETRRLLESCPTCGHLIPPDHEGLVTQAVAIRLVAYHYAAFCALCESYWTVTELRPFNSATPVRLTKPTRADPSYAAFCRKRLFTVRGRPEPTE